MSELADFIADEVIDYVLYKAADNDIRDEFADIVEQNRSQNKMMSYLINIVGNIVAMDNIRDDKEIAIVTENAVDMVFANWVLSQRDIVRELDRNTISDLEDLSDDLADLLEDFKDQRSTGSRRRPSSRTRSGRTDRTRRRPSAGADALSSAAASGRSFGTLSSKSKREPRERRSSRGTRELDQSKSNSGLDALTTAATPIKRDGPAISSTRPYDQFEKDGSTYYVFHKSPVKPEGRPWPCWTDPRKEIPFYAVDKDGIVTEVVIEMSNRLEYERNATMGSDWVRKNERSGTAQVARNALLANVLPKETITLNNDYQASFLEIYNQVKNMNLELLSVPTLEDALAIARMRAVSNEVSFSRVIMDSFLLIGDEKVSVTEMGSTGVQACNYLSSTTADQLEVAYYNRVLTERVNRVVYLLTGNENSIVSFKDHYSDLIDVMIQAVADGNFSETLLKSVVEAVNNEVVVVTTSRGETDAVKRFSSLMGKADISQEQKESLSKMTFTNPIKVLVAGYIDKDHWEFFPGVDKKPKVFGEDGKLVNITSNDEVNGVISQLLGVVNNPINGGRVVTEFVNGYRVLLECVGNLTFVSLV